ncbi:MAG: hypothetical protein CMM47_04040 [Rhodospirillaceae bacterium]|nr:hypothetical protein [Rhodospirillaceae bacterium]
MKLPIPIPSLSGILGRFRRNSDDETEEAKDSYETIPEGGPADPSDSDSVEQFADGAIGDDTIDGEFGEDSVDLPSDRTRKLGRTLGLTAAGLGVLVALGGVGTLVGWLVTSSEHAARDRENLRPSLTVMILEEGTPTPRNSSRVQKLETETDRGTAANKLGKESEVPDDPMSGVVDPTLIEETETGPLPKIAPDGRRAWTEYARAFDKSDRRPRLSIIVSNLGLSAKTTDAVLKALPPEVTLSFSPTALDLKRWVAQARKKGHEVLLDLPMEPTEYPKSDPGRDTLLTTASEVENLNRLERVMKRAGGYVGLLSVMGTRFTVSADSFKPILKVLQERGLIFVDGRATSRTMGPTLASEIQLPKAFNDRFIDAIPSARAINARLSELEQIVKDKRFAVGVADPYPITIDRLAAWLSTLNAKGIALAPITSVADRQSLH